jgi:hypothetical protein
MIFLKALHVIKVAEPAVPKNLTTLCSESNTAIYPCSAIGMGESVRPLLVSHEVKAVA